MPWKTVIADDEELARIRLKSLIGNYPNKFEIAGEACDGDELRLLLNKGNIDVVFLDIEMPGKDVFSILEELKQKPFIIFCTAYDQYALKAFDSLAVDYLVKPVDEERFSQTVDKLNRFGMPMDEFGLQKVIDTLRKMDPKQAPTTIPCKRGDTTRLIKLDQVVYFESDDKLVFFYTTDGQRCTTDLSLKDLEKKLPAGFIRVSKSTIVNREYVREMHRYFRGRMILVLDDGQKTKITSGASYAEAVREAFDW
ncbi:MAG: LytTR family DNA-binding domain-containing protein [Bacteroidales bacterium]